MLSEIHIRDFALIDQLDLTFEPGFSVLTGETGAGKSIIIDAISAVLGDRLSAEVVRTGADRAMVEAVFDVSDNPDFRTRAAGLDIEVADDTLFLSREITRAGKSGARVNGRLCPLSTLKDLTDGMLDLHGQHEHQSLLAADAHIDALDAWLGAEALGLRSRMAELHGELRDARKQIEELAKNERERIHLLDLYRFQIEEIESAKLTLGEEEELASDRSRLANAEKLYTLASNICEALSGDSVGGAVAGLGQAARQAEQMAALDCAATEAAEMLQSALMSAQEAQSFARSYRDELEFNPRRLESIEERLDLIRGLKRKYGETIEEILAYAETTAAKVRDMEHNEERGQELNDLLQRVLADANVAAQELSALRRNRACDFEAAVMRELSDLAMERTEFKVSIEDAEMSPRGMDAISFLISPNPGEPLKPLVKIASGGEMSRIMLALKSVMAAADRVPTLIFDEIDTGIGGRTANVIGDKLAALGKNAQVMCVTHLPQIASRAESHFHVEKHETNGRTVVRVTRLESENRAQELARMLGSTEAGADTALLHAREMLRGAAN